MPQLLNKIYDKIYYDFQDNWFKKWMLHTGLAVKEKAFKKEQNVCSRNNNTIWDKLIFEKVRNNFGGRIRVIVTGFSSYDERVSQILQNILGCVVCDDDRIFYYCKAILKTKFLLLVLMICFNFFLKSN